MKASASKRGRGTAPAAIDLTQPAHRLRVLRAYHRLLGEGLDEAEARRQSVACALENWADLDQPVGGRFWGGPRRSREG